MDYRQVTPLERYTMAKCRQARWSIQARATGSAFYLAPPYQAWARGTCESTIGLVRQYLPKGRSFVGLSQAPLHPIARHLNRRRRKRLGYQTPEACYASA